MTFAVTSPYPVPAASLFSKVAWTGANCSSSDGSANRKGNGSRVTV
jgi:hypothetical protein